jgi:N-acetylmuramoyl-L-alanine amidase
MAKVLVLDAGHGLNTSGKQTMNGSKGVIKEWTLNNNVCNKIQAILKDYDVTIHRTDDTTGKTDISLSERVKRCNNYKPHLFVSIHHNAGGGVGTEVYWHTKGTAEDKKVAGIVAPKLASKCGMRNRGVKQASFAVLSCKPTAILCEGGFMDSSDYEIITSDKGQQAYAEAVAESIIEYLGLKKVATSQPSSSTSSSSSTSTSAPVSSSDYKVGTYGKSVKVTADDGLNVRSERNASSTKIATLAKGAVVEVGYIMYENNQTTGTSLWGGVVVNGKQGFINLSYTEPCGDTVNSTSSSFLVEVICNSLNIRKSDNFDSAIVGTVKKGDVYTIVEVSNGLGLLKSYASNRNGWISMGSSYVKKK